MPLTTLEHHRTLQFFINFFFKIGILQQGIKILLSYYFQNLRLASTCNSRFYIARGKVRYRERSCAQVSLSHDGGVL